MKNLIIIRKIKIIRYLTDKFVILNIYISELINNRIKMIKIIIQRIILKVVADHLDRILVIKL